MGGALGTSISNCEHKGASSLTLHCEKSRVLWAFVPELYCVKVYGINPSILGQLGNGSDTCIFEIAAEVT